MRHYAVRWREFILFLELKVWMDIITGQMVHIVHTGPSNYAGPAADRSNLKTSSK